MKRKATFAAAGAIVLLSMLLIAGAPKQERRAEADSKARLRFRIESLVSSLGLGDWNAAFVEASRLRHERRTDGEIAALCTRVLEIADEGRRRPSPGAWDFDRLARAWGALASDDKTPPSLRALAEKRASQLVAERAAAEQMNAIVASTEYVAQMRLAAAVLRDHGSTLVVRFESARLAQIKLAFESRTRDDMAKHLAGDDPEWEAILGRIDEAAVLVGALEGDLRRMREKAAAGLEDLKLMKRVIELVKAADWTRASDLLGRLRAGSPYQKVADQARAGIRFQIRLEDAVAALRGGQGARAANDLTDLAAEWPQDLPKNADVVGMLAREVPLMVAEFADADKRRAAGELRRAITGYENVAASDVSSGWYRREAKERAAVCRAELAKTLEKTAKDFAAALDASDWIRALDSFEALAMIDAEGKRFAAARQRVTLLAASLCKEMEKRLYGGTFGARDRAAAALLEAALKGTDENRQKLEKLKKNYAKNFDGRMP